MNNILFTASFLLTLAIAPFTAFASEDASGTQADSPADTAEKPPKKPLFVTTSRYSEQKVSVEFSDAVTKDAFEKSISVEPSIEFSVKQNWETSFTISADFKPGETYAVSIAPTLSGIKSLPLGKRESIAFTVKDAPEELNFLSDGDFFPLCAKDFSLPISLRNLEKIRITVRQAYGDSVADFFLNPQNSDYSKTIFSQEVLPKARRNQREQYAVELEKIGIPRKCGIYSIGLEKPGQYYYYSYWNRNRLVVVTDLAIQATRNGEELAVAVKNISGNAAVPAAKISIFSRKKHLVLSADCDENGFAKIKLPPLEDKEDAHSMILAEAGDDKTFLLLHDLNSRRQQRGFEKQGARAYVFPERGICRPGEKIHLFAGLRDGKTKLAQGHVPAEFHIEDPSGNTFLRIPVNGDAFGFYKTAVEIPAFAATGSYEATLRIPGQEDSEFGNTTFSVAEYVPDAIEVSVKTKRENNSICADGNAAYYFGLPLADGKIDFSCDFKFTRFTPKNREFSEFLFGLIPANSFNTLQATGKSDDAGQFSARFDIPKYEKRQTATLRAVVRASAASGAGSRSVSAYNSTEIHNCDFYFGTREKSADERGRVFEICTLSPNSEELKLEGKKFKASLYRNEWNYLVREQNGTLRCEWQRESIPAGSIEFDGSASEIALPIPQVGEYKLVVSDAANADVLHEREFWHYYGESGGHPRNPSEITFRLDREKYLPGETAKVTFDSPFAGNAVLLVGSENIETMQHISLTVGENVVEIPIPEITASGSRFFSVTASGKTEPGASELVQRRFGVGVLPVDQQARTIFVKTEVPEVTRPGEKAQVRVRLSDAAGKPVAGTLQLWAVDRGVLSLTNFKTPNPFAYFFGTYDCPYEFGDSYSDFYPLLALDKKLFGGGASLSKFLNDRDESKQSAVVMLDTVNVPASGEATVEIVAPDFDGGMRLMAVALNEEKTGSGDNTFIVREPVSVQMTAPRAVAPGDSFEIVTEIFNTDLPEQKFSWQLDFGGAKLASGESDVLKPGQKHVLRTPLAAPDNNGAKKAELRVFDANGKLCSQEYVSISVRAALPAQDNVGVTEIAPGAEAYFPNSQAFGEISVGSPALALAGALDWLEAYPYGCLEQVSAAALPHLAVPSLIESGLIHQAFGESSAGKIRNALGQISTMRLYNGKYAMWPCSDEAWAAGTLFAIHFELEADANGFPLTQARRATISRILAQFVNSRNPEAQRAYAVYLLSLMGDKRIAAYAKPMIYAEKNQDFSRFLAAAALVKSGYAAEGMKTILPLLETAFWSAELANWDSCLDSSVRRAGITLRILSEIAPDAPENALIAQFISKQILPSGHWGSTQKNAWAAFGLAAYFTRVGGYGSERALLEIDGETSELKRAIRVPGGKSLRIKNVGERPISTFVRTREIPKDFKPIRAGFEITREYLDINGNPISQCSVGDFITVKINIRSKERCPSAVVCDLLPGGLEIEDETLATRAQAAPKSQSSGYAYSELARERRFDRFLSFGSTYADDEWATLSYRVRATSRGKFTIPPIQIESMYEGEKRAAWQPENTVFEVR